jgi:UDP-N-acetylmuramoyl-tripeptide--D-alanyl-D-alanine ligase
MFYILTPFWFIRETKAILFWLYLWQSKEYHIGRFIDHFRTEKGKRIFFNKLLFLKIILLIFLSFAYLLSKPSPKYEVFIYLLVIFYFFELIKGFYDFFQKKLKYPVLTKKTVFLISFGLLFAILFPLSLSYLPLVKFSLWLLVFDILTPAVTSGIVLIFQPLTVLGRNQIIKKAKEKREKFKNLLVIGITGSYGKTSTKEFLATILSEKFKVLKTAEHQNSEVGISQCILNDLKPEHEIFIVEMGAYNRGGIKLLCDIAKPKIGILTGINEQHMATFGSQENIIKGKYELIEFLPENGLAIFNGNNKYCHELYQKTKKSKKIIYNTISTAVENVLHKDFWAENIKVEKEWISFKVVSSDGDSADFKVNLLGAQNVENILLATCCAKKLGMSLKEISKACEKISEAQSGIRLIKTKDGLNIIDATYSANPDGVISHLEYLKIWPGKKVIIMPCLIELGPASKEIHKRIGKKIGEVCDLAIITTKERFEEIKDGSASSPRRGATEVIFLEDPKEIFEKIKTFCQPEDIILLESRVPAFLFK